MERYDSVDLLEASWEGQSGSRAGHQRGAVNPRSLFIYNMVRVINFFQREQLSPMIYLLQNIYPGEVCTSEVTKAGKLVQTLLGEPTLIDGADLGAAAHRVRLFWRNKLPAPILQAALPKKLPPFPVLQNLLQPYHTRTRQGHTYQYLFVKQNRVGYVRVYMPTRVSYLESNASRPKRNGAPEKGQVFNTFTTKWDDPDVREKEILLGFAPHSTHTPRVSQEQCAIRVGQALDDTTMAWLGAFLQSSHN